MLAAVPGIYFFITLFTFRLPFQMSSDRAGTICKPGAFYLFEDLGAVDFRHGKPFRRMLHARWVHRPGTQRNAQIEILSVNYRYNASPVYRDLMWYITLFWTYGCALYFGASAAVCWTASFDFAYGFILGRQ